MKSRLPSAFLVAAGIALTLAVCAARADEATNTLKFSDPSKPGTVRISLGRGELRVQGTDTNEVTIKSDAQAITNKRTKDGLRVISTSSGFSLTEKDNTIVVDASPHEFGRAGNTDFRVTVPRNTTIIVQNAWGGDITCLGISGDIEINSMRGEIRLEDVSGGVVAGTMNGEIKATIRELREGKPLSFTSMNGEVIIRVPDTAKANVRLRTQNGSVLTDFEETVLVTKAEASSPSHFKNAWTIKGGGSKVINAEVEEAIREATRISATAVKQALEAVKEGLAASRLDAEEAHRQVEEARKEMDRARRESDRARREVDRERRTAPVAATPPSPPTRGTVATAPKPPVPPKVAIPTMSGGKLVTGTLNGGGPEISVSTMNGDVTLRKLTAQK